MKKFVTLTAFAAIAMVSAQANAAEAEAGAGAKIIAPLQIARTADLYFGTIAPSLTAADVVTVDANGTRVCGDALTCLTSDYSAAAFKVTGEADAAYTISLPDSISIVNKAGDKMEVTKFNGSKAGGTLIAGADSFTVGGSLLVGALQPAGQYTGSFTVAVEYQ